MKTYYIMVLFVLILAIAGCQQVTTPVVKEQQAPQITVLEPIPEVNTQVLREIITIDNGRPDIDTLTVPLMTDAEITFVNQQQGNESAVRLVSGDADVYLRAREQYTLSVPAQEDPTFIYFEVNERLGTIIVQ